MSDTEETMDPNGRVGFRDIYRAVGESEQRIVARIDALVGPLSVQMVDHEQRLRSIETHGSPDSQALAVRVEANSQRLTALETAVNFFNSREVGIRATLGMGKALLLVAIAVASPIISAALILYTSKP